MATERCITDYPAIHGYPHAALLATPRQFGNCFAARSPGHRALCEAIQDRGLESLQVTFKGSIHIVLI
ncbi:hypothetical protein V2I81_24815 [Pseudomonas viridiflava]|nr:hypothetical protein [Pseudomonas viridiflava]